MINIMLGIVIGIAVTVYGIATEPMIRDVVESIVSQIEPSAADKVLGVLRGE